MLVLCRPLPFGHSINSTHHFGWRKKNLKCKIEEWQGAHTFRQENFMNESRQLGTFFGRKNYDLWCLLCGARRFLAISSKPCSIDYTTKIAIQESNRYHLQIIPGFCLLLWIHFLHFKCFSGVLKMKCWLIVFRLNLPLFCIKQNKSSKNSLRLGSSLISYSWNEKKEQKWETNKKNKYRMLLPDTSGSLFFCLEKKRVHNVYIYKRKDWFVAITEIQLSILV